MVNGQLWIMAIERVVYREFFPRGLTAVDYLDEAMLGVPAEPLSRHRPRGVIGAKKCRACHKRERA